MGGAGLAPVVDGWGVSAAVHCHTGPLSSRAAQTARLLHAAAAAGTRSLRPALSAQCVPWPAETFQFKNLFIKYRKQLSVSNLVEMRETAKKEKTRKVC